MPEEERNDVTPTPADHAREVLSHRLRLLIDAWEFQNGDKVTHPMIAAHCEAHGVSLSRPRWSYMCNGTGYLVTDENLLRAIARFFKVEEQYLLDLDSEPPASVSARFNFIQDLREQRVERFAARNLAGIAPETLSLISEAIKKSRERREGGSHAP